MRTAILLSVSLQLIGFGCTRANPAFRGASDGGPFDAEGDVPADGVAAADAGSDLPGDRPIDLLLLGDLAGDPPRDRPGDATPDNPPACVIASDCTARNGAPVCGTWVCRSGACALNCPNCTDADGDGFGVGSGCAGLDCDDTDPAIHATAQRSCYSGPAGTSGVGACRSGRQSCTNGVWTACTGEVGPSAEACNGEDDDCHGGVDDGLPMVTCGLGACQNTVPSCGAAAPAACVPHSPAMPSVDPCGNGDEDCDGQVDEDCPTVIDACIKVSPDGDDGSADGTLAAPFRTIAPAIALATTTSKMVCVAADRDCGNRTTYMLADGAAFVMVNGVSVYGNYESSRWTRCPINPSAPDPYVTIELREAAGVRFPMSITTATALDGFVLTRATVNTATAPITAVTVNGAKLVRLSNLVVNDAPQAARTYGVNLINGGEALITHCAIGGGAGTVEAIGVHSVAAKPTIRENCTSIDPVTGRCLSTCSPPPGLGIAGRVSAATVGASVAVHLEASPGALVETSTLCASQGGQAIGVHVLAAAAAATAPAATAIRGNIISATSANTDSIGVWAEDCGDAAPWIVGNQLVEGQGGIRAVGVMGIGNCDPVIDGNTLISAGGDATTTEADGVSCQANVNGEASRCAVLGNVIQGSSSFRPALTAGVACKEGGCVRVAGNIVQGNQGVDVIGVWLRNDGTTVERNRITGGCAGQTAVGILADDTFARLQNNLVSGGSCPTAASPSPLSIGVRVYSADDQNEIDIHSNTIDAGGNAGLCTSTGIEYGVGPETPPTAPKGIIRNNIVRSGACNARYDFSEARPASDPRLFENNDLDPTGLPVLYLDENATPIRLIATVNGLTDITARNNLGANPMFVSFPSDLHLGAGSTCIGAGTPTGAPPIDLDGKPRSTTKPSIGAYE